MTLRPNVAVFGTTASGRHMLAVSKAMRLDECKHRSLASKVRRIWHRRLSEADSDPSKRCVILNIKPISSSFNLLCSFHLMFLDASKSDAMSKLRIAMRV